MKNVFAILLFVILSIPLVAQHSHENEYDPVRLDEGKRWSANLETTQGVSTMTRRVEKFQAEKGANTAELHQNLLTDFRGIFANCTMEGASHDQLHNYLIPLRDLLNELAECDDCAQIVNHIEKHLNEYASYFE